MEAQIWPAKVFTLHGLSEPCCFFFFSTRTIFTRARTTSPKVPARVQIFGSAWLKFGTDRLFTLQILSEPNRLFGTRAIFPPAVPEIFCNVNRALVLFAIPDVKITGLKSYIWKSYTESIQTFTS